MIDNISAALGIINFKVLLFSALLFFLGYAAAPTIYYKKIRWLLGYPMWIVKMAG